MQQLFLERLQSTFGLVDSQTTLTGKLDRVFTALETAGATPGSITTRGEIVNALTALSQEIARTAAVANGLRRDADQQMAIEVQTINDALVQIATQQPKSTDELVSIRLVPQGLSRSDDGKALVEAVGRALAIPNDELPKREFNRRPPPDAPAALVDLMKTLLRAKCEMEGVAPRLVANMADIERFATEDNAESPLMKGWRHDVFGRDAQRLKEGKLALAPDGDVLKLIEI